MGTVIWIGGHQVGSNWFWFQGAQTRKMSVTDWASSQPESDGKGAYGPKCLFLAEERYGYRWHDAPCFQRRSYICERSY